MRTVGQTLKEYRINQGYSLEDIERHTKIRKELLEALEADNYSKLPPSTFVQGFIKNYSKFLNLNSEKLLAIYRRDFEVKKHPPLVMQSFSNPLRQRRFFFTPGKAIGVVVAILVIGFFAYLWVEYRQFVGAPNLTVDSPKDQQTVDIPDVTISGNTDPEVKVSVNNQQIGVDKNGHFNEDIKLSQSTNDILIMATSKFGQSAKIDRTVFVKK